MNIEKLDFILNDALNKALISKDRIKQPNSNKVADFVSKYITDNAQSLQLLQGGVSGSALPIGFKIYECTDCKEINVKKDNRKIRVGFCDNCDHPLWNDDVN